MKQGLYEKRKEVSQSNEQTALPERHNRQIRISRKNKKKKNSKVGIIIIALVVLVVLIIFRFALHSSPLEGSWKMDDVTSYEFYDNGKGAMVLPSAEYEFSYSIDEDTVYIDFVYDGAKDAQYSFVVEGGTLTLTGGNETTQGTFVLTKYK